MFILTFTGTLLTCMLHLSLFICSHAGYTLVIKVADRNHQVTKILFRICMFGKKNRHTHTHTHTYVKYFLQNPSSVSYFPRLPRKLRLLTVRYSGHDKLLMHPDLTNKVCGLCPYSKQSITLTYYFKKNPTLLQVNKVWLLS